MSSSSSSKAARAFVACNDAAQPDALADRFSAASRAELERALQPHGLRLRGGFVPDPNDALPALPGERCAAVVWIVGQLGSSCWNAFLASPFACDGLPNPMDRWSRSIAQGLAERWHGLALLPSDGPPYHPFARWAERAEPLGRSPIGMQIHPVVGLWHAYRFALALPQRLPDEDTDIVRVGSGPRPDPCSGCADRPCLATCPVGAFRASGYDVPACAAHLHREQGADCMALGCRARRSCPVGRQHTYDPLHAAFHMAHFAGKHRPARSRES